MTSTAYSLWNRRITPVPKDIPIRLDPRPRRLTPKGAPRANQPVRLKVRDRVMNSIDDVRVPHLDIATGVRGLHAKGTRVVLHELVVLGHPGLDRPRPSSLDVGADLQAVRDEGRTGAGLACYGSVGAVVDPLAASLGGHESGVGAVGGRFVG